MKRYLFYLYSVLGLVFLSCNQLASQDGLTHVKSEGFHTLVSNDSVQLIDVRTPKEFSEGHLEHSVNIDYFSDDFFKNIGVLNIQKPVYIYCRSGNRSAKSVSQFKKAGFTQIYNLDGGILDWKDLELPIVVEN